MSNKTDWPKVARDLFVAAGVPLVAGLAFAEQVSQHPWQALGLALLYEMSLAVVRFGGKVWGKLEERWVERVAEGVDSGLLRFAPRYHKRYLQHLIYRHRDFDVKGLSTQGTYTLALERIFVELSIAPQPAHKTSADPIRAVPEALRKGRHVVWDYLQSEPMAD
ncbi:MAG: hypothetical protein PVF45_09630 [Anaerolineae bacterium]|jgi:hypothetical protein